MELCVGLDVPPRPGAAGQVQVVVLVVVLVVVTAAARAGVVVPDIVLSGIVSGLLSAAGIQAARQVPIFITGGKKQ